MWLFLWVVGIPLGFGFTMSLEMEADLSSFPLVRLLVLHITNMEIGVVFLYPSLDNAEHHCWK